MALLVPPPLGVENKDNDTKNYVEAGSGQNNNKLKALYSKISKVIDFMKTLTFASIGAVTVTSISITFIAVYLLHVPVLITYVAANIIALSLLFKSQSDSVKDSKLDKDDGEELFDLTSSYKAYLSDAHENNEAGCYEEFLNGFFKETYKHHKDNEELLKSKLEKIKESLPDGFKFKRLDLDYLAKIIPIDPSWLNYMEQCDGEELSFEEFLLQVSLNTQERYKNKQELLKSKEEEMKSFLKVK